MIIAVLGSLGGEGLADMQVLLSEITAAQITRSRNRGQSVLTSAGIALTKPTGGNGAQPNCRRCSVLLCPNQVIRFFPVDKSKHLLSLSCFPDEVADYDSCHRANHCANQHDVERLLGKGEQQHLIKAFETCASRYDGIKGKLTNQGDGRTSQEANKTSNQKTGSANSYHWTV
jgi:hypothetical protein